ncbi:MAG: hypothetical protein PSN04_03975 [Methyloprofundus sp.]|nr:hypothetical protein [Methyloprofundus sp.]
MNILLELIANCEPIFIFFKNSFSYVGGIIVFMIFLEKLRTHFSAKYNNTRRQYR